MGVIRIPKLRCAPGALLALLLLLPEIEMGAQSGDPTFSNANWSSMGAGVNGSVVALVASGKDLYAGGTFRTAGGISANYIAKWDGRNWTALGSGMDSTVQALKIQFWVGQATGRPLARSVRRLAGRNGSDSSSDGHGLFAALLAEVPVGE